MFPSLREETRKLLEKALGGPMGEIDLADSQMADLCSPVAFRLARERKRDPKEIAKELADKIVVSGFVREVRAENGYVNFYFDWAKVAPKLLKEIRSSGDSYGGAEKKKEKIILEHTSINPSGPVHIGRLRNSLIGDSLSRILSFNGFSVETRYYVNDVGKQIAIIAQGFKEKIEPDASALKEYAEYKDKADFLVFFEYVAANRRFEEDASFAERVQETIKRAEEGDEKVLDEITQVAQRCLSGQKKIFDLLDIRFDFFDFESECIRDGSVKDVISYLAKTEYAEENENGFGLDLSSFGLERRGGLSMLARKDKTSVYLARDIAYHLEKSKSGSRMINVLGEDHKFEFQELHAILAEIYGMKTPLDVVHFSFVSFEGMELSTRKGLTAPVDRLLDEARKKAEEEIEKRGVGSPDAASVIAFGAVKYHILKTAPLKQITFRWDEALSFDGEAAPYIQYAHARCCSILEKAGVEFGKIIPQAAGELAVEEEKLVSRIARFPEAVSLAGKELKPNIIAAYAYELAAAFSRFYRECPVLSEDETVRSRRLQLVDATRQTIKNALQLLGIDAPEKM